MDINNLVIGTWYDFEGRFGELIKVIETKFDLIDELYDRNTIVGGNDISIVIYKAFCKYDGKIIKRGRISIANADYVKSLTNGYKIVVDELKNDNPKAWDSFELEEYGGVFKSSIDGRTMVKYDSKEEFFYLLDKIIETLPTKFSALEFIGLYRKYDMDRFIVKSYLDGESFGTNFSLKFKWQDYEVKDGFRIYCGLNYNFK